MPARMTMPRDGLRAPVHLLESHLFELNEADELTAGVLTPAVLHLPARSGGGVLGLWLGFGRALPRGIIGDVGDVGDVGGDGGNPAARRPLLGQPLFEQGFAPGDADHRRPGPRQGRSDGAPDAGTGAGHQRHFTG